MKSAAVEPHEPQLQRALAALHDAEAAAIEQATLHREAETMVKELKEQLQSAMMVQEQLRQEVAEGKMALEAAEASEGMVQQELERVKGDLEAVKADKLDSCTVAGTEPLKQTAADEQLHATLTRQIEELKVWKMITVSAMNHKPHVGQVELNTVKARALSVVASNEGESLRHGDIDVAFDAVLQKELQQQMKEL